MGAKRLPLGSEYSAHTKNFPPKLPSKCLELLNLHYKFEFSLFQKARCATECDASPLLYAGFPGDRRGNACPDTSSAGPPRGRVRHGDGHRRRGAIAFGV